MAGPSSRVVDNKAIGNKCKAIGNKNASPPSKKKSVPGGKTSHQGKVTAKSPARGNNPRGHPPRKTMENLVSPQVSPVQDQSVSPVQSVTAVSPHGSVVASPVQSMAMPHPAALQQYSKKWCMLHRWTRLLPQPWMKLKISMSIGRHPWIGQLPPGLATHTQEVKF